MRLAWGHGSGMDPTINLSFTSLAPAPGLNRAGVEGGTRIPDQPQGAPAPGTDPAAITNHNAAGQDTVQVMAQAVAVQVLADLHASDGGTRSRQIAIQLDGPIM